MRKCLTIFLLICLVILSYGCSPEEPVVQYSPESTEVWADSMETEPVLDYDVPETIPGVLVPRTGYPAKGEKTVVFQGEILPDTFSVVDAATGQIVYTGETEPAGYSEQWDEYISYGEFSSLKEEGEYYIECAYIGRSYTFRVEKGLYEKLMSEAVIRLSEKQSELFLMTERPSDGILEQQCRSLAALLLACELFPEAQIDGSLGEANDIPDILEYAAKQVEWLAKWQSEADGSVGDATAWYCGALAKFSYTYQKYDSVYATLYLQAADKAWKYMTKHDGKIDSSQRFFAATELYRATGKYAYHSAAKELGRAMSPNAEDEALTYGGITYISTRRNVDVDLCNGFLLDLMEQAENISAVSKENTFRVAAELGQGDTEDFFRNITVMSVVDYVITNQEYATVIEDHHHYLTGRNHEGENYLWSESEKAVTDAVASEELWQNPVYVARYLLMLSEIRSHE